MCQLKRKAFIFGIFIILVSFCALSCRQKVTDSVAQLIKKKCAKNEHCEIKLEDVTSFDWDEFYFFDHARLNQEVNKILNKQVFNDSLFSGGYSDKLVFIKNGEIIHKENQTREVEEIFDDNIYFEINQSQKFGRFPKDALFKVKKTKSRTGEYYNLTCLNCN